MGNTPRSNLPWPAGTEKVRNGAAAIQALAVAVDPGLVLSLAPPASAALIAAYPSGISTFVLSAAGAAADGGWPAAVTSSVYTVKADGSQAVQYWTRWSSTLTDVWVRQITSSVNSPWNRVAGLDYRALTGTSTLSPSDGVWATLGNWAATEANVGGITTDAVGLILPAAGTYEFTAMIEWAGGTSAGAVAHRRIMGFGGPGDTAPKTFLRSSTPNAGTNAINQTYCETVTVAGADIGRWCLFAMQNSTYTLSIGNRRFTAKRVG